MRKIISTGKDDGKPRKLQFAPSVLSVDDVALPDNASPLWKLAGGLLFQPLILGCEERWSEGFYRDGGKISEA
jgi:hypothetical protein